MNVCNCYTWLQRAGLAQRNLFLLLTSYLYMRSYLFYIQDSDATCAESGVG
jgi:hypothetical protein